MKKLLFVSGPHNILLFAAIVGIFIFLYATFDAFNSELDIQIVFRETVCSQPLNNRCSYRWTVKKTDGRLEAMMLSSFAYQADDLIAGNSIKKERFSFYYEINGHRKIWPFAANAVEVLLLSVVALRLWISNRVRSLIKSILR